jgi:hypothetical protein
MIGRAWLISGRPSWRIYGRSFWPTCGRRAGPPSSHPSSPCSGPAWRTCGRTFSRSFSAAGQAGQVGHGLEKVQCSRRTLRVSRREPEGYSPSAADPSSQSRTNPSPYNEARPSSLPPNACAAPPAAGVEARSRPPVKETYNMHVLRPCARHDARIERYEKSPRCGSLLSAL